VSRPAAADVEEQRDEQPVRDPQRQAGIRDREIWIGSRPRALEEYGLTFEDVGRVLAGSNRDLPAGQLKSDVGNIRVRTLGERSRAAEIEMVAPARRAR